MADLKPDWRFFDSADVWIMDTAALTQLATKQPQQFAALRDYLIGGGSLWLLGQLEPDQIREWFRLPQTETVISDATVQNIVNDVAGQWHPDQLEPFRAAGYNSWYGRTYLLESLQAGPGFRNMLPTQQGNSGMMPFDENLQWLKDRDQTLTFEPARFSLYSMGLGGIVHYRDDNAIPGTSVQWVAFDQLTGVNLIELLRRGVDPCFGDRRFFDWIVPGVAQPPVYTFMGLLLIFVIIVGPISYRKVTKLGRGYLMMFIAPILAAATTLLMFGYGLIADGLTTQGRIREITFVGDRDGRAVRYSRGAYFAGISPIGGLTFPANASVVSYELPTVNSFYEAAQADKNSLGTVTVTEDRYQFSKSFLPSRQQKQFVTYRPLADFGTIAIEQGKSEAGSATEIMVRNETSASLEAGVLRTDDGSYYGFESLPAGERSVLVPLPSKDARTALSKLYARQRPLPPAALSGAKRRDTPTIDLLGRLIRDSVRVPRIRTSVDAGESLIEYWLRQQLQLASELPPGYFVAVSSVTDDCVATEVENLTESIHYVLGVMK